VENVFDKILSYLNPFAAAGVTSFWQFATMYAPSINPIIFRLFQRRHYLLFLIGTVGAFFNARVILPFMLLIVLDLDYLKLTKKEKKWLLVFFILQVFIFLFNSRWNYGY
jgi:hypothetical protein